MKRIISFVIAAALLMAAAYAESALNLPAHLKRIEEEAFAGVSADVVTVPEGVTSIGARAFRGGEIGWINLPTTLRSGAIAGDALPLPDTGITVGVTEGSWAHEWAEALGYLVHLHRFEDAYAHTVEHPASTRIIHHGPTIRTIYHPAEYETIEHPATYKTIEHEPQYRIVHHGETIRVIHHDAEVKTVHHGPETKTIHHSAEYNDYNVYTCTFCGFETTSSEEMVEHLSGDNRKAGHVDYTLRLERELVKDAWDETIVVKEAWDEEIVVKPAWDEEIVVKPAWDEEILVSEAWTEQVVDTPAWTEQVLVKDAWEETIVIKEAWDETVQIEAWTEVVYDSPDALREDSRYWGQRCADCGYALADH